MFVCFYSQNHTRKVDAAGGLTKIPLSVAALSNITDGDLKVLGQYFDSRNIGPDGRPISKQLQDQADRAQPEMVSSG